MATEGTKRKLAAILSADVKEYSRLMGQDERGTIRTLTAYKEAMSSLIQEYKGRVVDAPGDNLLAEFGSVVDAVNCAVEIQRELAERNAELPYNRRMEFRIGINLGDIVEEEKRIYGDGVNIAARVESLAEGGGICISGKVHEEVKNKLGLEYEFLGEQEVKNIAEPVPAYRVLSVPGAAAHRVVKAKKTVGRSWRNSIIVIVAVLVVGAGVAIWNFFLRTSPPSVEPASVEKMAFPLPDKPSIAVLPFVNVSGDPEQDYITDGITENIISSLSRVPKIFVIARNSTFTYKGKAVKVQQVAEELGVRYVLEGSVQKSGKSLRITAQLIDAINGHHLWSERYDRELKDMFALQDEIALKIIGAIQVELTEGEQAHLRTKKTENLQAYLKYLQARDHINSVTKEGNTVGRQILKEVIALDPNFSPAYLALGATHWLDILLGSSRSPEESLKQAFKLTKKALALDDSDGSAHTLLGYLYTRIGQYDKAITECEQGIDLSPNSDFAHLYMGLVLSMAGKREEAVRFCEQAIRLSPIPPGYYFRVLAGRYLLTTRYEEAIIASKKALESAPNDLIAHIVLAAAYVQTGREDEARTEVTEALKINPKFSLKYFAKSLMYKNKADKEFVLNALRKAGLPETPPLPLPDKPSIAVLPFVNMSDDPKQEYFSDGITEEIITALSKTPKLFVIARNSSFTYKGKPVKVQQVGRELGVKYVLEGSVRKAKDRLRITAQLIDATTGNHLWAERYDRDLRDIFDLQDEITKNIIMALHIELTPKERTPIYGKETDKLEAYLKVLEGEWYSNKGTKEGIIKAQQLAQDAIDLDPNYAYAYHFLGNTYGRIAWLGITKSPRKAIKRCIELHQKAITLDNSLAIAHATLGWYLTSVRQYDKAIAAGERAISLEPTAPIIISLYASILTFAGRNDEAIPFFQEALRPDPIPSQNLLYRTYGTALANTGRYEEAIAFQKRAIEKNPNDVLAYLVLASVYSFAGRDSEAQAIGKEVLRLNPRFSIALVEKVRLDKDPAVAKRWIDALRKAGLPD